MSKMIPTYYACLRRIDGTVEKKPFKKREDASKYIAEHYNELEYTAAWTE